MNWTTPTELKAQVHRLWERGVLLAAMANGKAVFPRRLVLKPPSSTELSEKFDAVRVWIAALQDAESRGYRIVWREVNHRVLGRNRMPAEVWLDSQEMAIGLLGKRTEVQQFAALVAETRRRFPELLPWLGRYPFKALAVREAWPRLLDVIDWLRAHPRPGVYLKQVDLAGVHSKFIERHRGILAELLDLTLPPEAIDHGASGLANFCSRYGFREKPVRVRFRILDAELALFPRGEQDITFTHDTFAQLDLPVRQVFITENETNFLAFPLVTAGMVIFGAGYGFDMLAEAQWLRARAVFYWGDIDTHGFAILDQLRARLPHAASLLMDRDTLLAHRVHWSTEREPEKRSLPRLNAAEAALYDELRMDRLGHGVRLEQEKIGFAWLERALQSLK